jgi:N-acetylmuramoyl-L-alanine amidase
MLFLLEEEERLGANSLCSDSPIVLIDAGHGGEDGGAVGLGGILEKEINLGVSKKLELVLNLCGINTDMTRRGDEALYSENEETTRQRKVADIKKRVEWVQSTPEAILISVHQNSFPQDNCKGAQVFYSRANIKSKDFAEVVQASLKDGLDRDNRRKAKVSDKTIYLLNNVNCPAILIECGFISNTEECTKLPEKEYQKELCFSILCGIIEYVKQR